MPITRKSLAQVAIIAMGGLGLSACATTDYVDEQIAMVNTRIDGVDAKASQAASAAAAADAKAQAAATEAQNANRRHDALTLGTQQILMLEQTGHRFARLRTHAQPMVGAFQLQIDGLWIGHWVVRADGLDKATVAGGLLVGHDNAIKWFLFGAHTAQANTNHVEFFSLNQCSPNNHTGQAI